MSDTDEQPIDHTKSQTEAAWAAVHEARRGLSIAWISTLINALVVVVALFTPYIQLIVNEQTDKKRYAVAKQILLDDTKSFQNNHVDVLKSFFAYAKLNGKGGLDTDGKRKAFEGILRNKIESEQRRNDFESSNYDKEPIDLPFRQALSLQRSGIDLEIKLLRDFVSAFENSETNDDFLLSDIMDMAYNARENRLIYKLNTDQNGKVRPGPVIFARCDDEQFTSQCISEKEMEKEILQFKSE